MARPLPASGPHQGGSNGTSYTGRSSGNHLQNAAQEIDSVRQENEQLRQLCADLEQALQEATRDLTEASAPSERLRECEALLEEKTETIRRLYLELDEARAAAEAVAAAAPARPSPQGPAPREEELLALSEEL